MCIRIYTDTAAVTDLVAVGSSTGSSNFHNCYQGKASKHKGFKALGSNGSSDFNSWAKFSLKVWTRYMWLKIIKICGYGIRFTATSATNPAESLYLSMFSQVAVPQNTATTTATCTATCDIRAAPPGG